LRIDCGSPLSGIRTPNTDAAAFRAVAVVGTNQRCQLWVR
jgi:hypothetical protein